MPNNTDDWLTALVRSYAQDLMGSTRTVQVIDHYEKQFRKAITQRIEEAVAMAEKRCTDNAVTIAEYWLENDGRPKHLIQDLWDIKDISVLDHIPTASKPAREGESK
jgi:hypothetical protein